MSGKDTTKKRSLRPWIRWSLIALALPLIALATLYLAVRAGFFGPLPGPTELAAIKNEQATLVLAKDGALIGKIFDRDRTNVQYADLPEHLVQALVATEDRRFFQHEGVDAWSYLRVLFRAILPGEQSGGGSTISQQVVKNIYGRRGRGLPSLLVNKMREVIIAQRLEKVYSKEEVILLYLNSVPFGENAYGIGSAAHRYFGKSTSALRVEEAAVLVGLLKANTTYDPRLHPEAAKARRNEVIQLMGRQGDLSSRAVDSLQTVPLVLDHQDASSYDAYGYFVHRVEQEAQAILDALAKRTGTRHDLRKDGLRIQTTLDTTLQRMAMAAARQQLRTAQIQLDRELRARRERAAWEKVQRRTGGSRWKKNERRMRQLFDWNGAWVDSISYRDSLWHYERMLNAAVLMMEPRTGRVRAWVGGNDHRFLPFDLVTAPHPIASTIKPFLYAAALEEGMDPCTQLDNERHVHPEYEDWEPANFDETSGGLVSMWYALTRSMNLPTVDLYFRTSLTTIERTLKALGLPTEGAEHPAMALGALDMTLLEAVRGYCAFANEGRIPAPVLIERITDTNGKTLYQTRKDSPRQAVQPGTAAAITTMLQRAVDEGTGAALRSRSGVHAEVAGKTGTAQDQANAWFIAYTPELVCGTWVGCRDPRIHFQSKAGSGAQLALPIVGSVLSGVERSRELRKRYLKPFVWTLAYEVNMDCEPMHDPSALEEAIDDLFGPRHHREQAVRSDSVRAGGRKKGDGFLRRLFKRKR